MSLYTFDKSTEWFERAAAVIPGGIPGHLSPAMTVPGSYPYYATEGKGCRYTDVDGNEYIDFLCGYGPVVLGFNHPKVDQAAQERRAIGSVFNHPTTLSVQLAEKLVELTPIGDWATFARNGSDVATYSVLVARQHTQRRKILMARGAYHGTHAWCIHSIAGILPEDYEHVLPFTWNDADEIRDLCNQHKGDVAGIIVTPYHHPAFGDSVMPAPGFYDAVQSICEEHDLVLINDDVRAGFRLDMGGSNEYFGFKPDIICYCKALANGHVISAAVGNDRVKQAASAVFFTGSYFNAATEMAASLACLDHMAEADTIGKMMKTGAMLQEGLKACAEGHGLQVNVTGPPTMPTMTFANEANFRRMQRFSAEAAHRGVLFHPHHNWFMMAAHEEADVQEALDVADVCFKIVKDEYGS